MFNVRFATTRFDVKTSIKRIRARFRAGVLEPLDVLDLPDESQVRLTIEPLVLTEKNDAATRFKRAAGSWKDVPESLIDELYAERSTKTREDAVL